jgi:hypothetical protein
LVVFSKFRRLWRRGAGIEDEAEITKLLRIDVENVICNMEEAEAMENFELEARKKWITQAILKEMITYLHRKARCRFAVHRLGRITYLH